MADGGEEDATASLGAGTDALESRIALVDVSFLEVHAVRREMRPPGEDAARGKQVTLSARVESPDDDIIFIVRASVSVPDAEYAVEAAATFHKQEAFDVDLALVKEFLETRAVPMLWPYLRQQVASLASTLRAGRVLLPVLRGTRVSMDEERDNTDDA